MKQIRMNSITRLIALGKQPRSFLVLASLWMAFSPWQARASFTNAGFESNSFSSWTVNSWTFASPLSPYPPTSIQGLGLTSASSNGFTNIVSAGTDANTNNNLQYPLYGTHAAVVNFGGTTHTASSIYQTATMASSDIDQSDSKIHIRFAIAPVLENPAHPANEQPFFAVEVKDITKGSTLYFQYNYAGQAGVPWLTGQGSFQYTNWQAIDIAPGAGQLDVGDSVSIQIVASRCEPGGHYGYVYVDAGDTGTFFPGLQVAASASSANAYRGTNFSYTYNYSNTSNAAINSVQVAATLPTGTTFVSTTGSSCTQPAVGSTGTVTCSLGTLAAGASGSFVITVLVANSATSPLSNGTYSISGTGTPSLLGPLVQTPIPDFTLSGPSGGPINTASTNFTIQPNAAYTGTITITPSGGGISTPVVLTYSSSSAAQTFTVTPTSTGPVTLTPSNSGGLINPSNVSYATSPAAPAIGTAIAGPGSAAVSFTPPGVTGGSAITGYTATCNPGALTGTGTSSPITVSGLTGGTAYTCSVTATNAYGTSAASSASNTVTPGSVASSYSLTGPLGGALNVASSSFTVAPNAQYSGTITITPSGGGLSSPIVLTFSNSSVPQTFTITPSALGPITLTPSNSGSLPDPGALIYATPPAAPVIGSVTAGNGSASISFTPPGANGGSAITTYGAICNPGALTGTGLSSPVTVAGLTNGTAYTCSVTAVNSYGTSPASAASNSVTPVAGASSYTFTGPAGGSLNVASSSFTVTPNAAYSGTITIAPAGGGLSAPIILTFSNSADPQTFTVTPTAIGPVSLTASNSGSLSDPPALTYATPSDAPVVGLVTPGNGSATVAFTAPENNGGSVVTAYTVNCSGYTASGTSSPITVSGLPNGSVYTCTVTATNGAGTSAPAALSNAVTPIAPPNSFTLTGPSSGAVGSVSGAFTVTPNSLYTGTITITPSGGGLTAPITLTFNNSADPQTFTVTPTATGPVLLTASNSGLLSNPPAFTYATPSDAPVVGLVTPGNGSATVAFTAPENNGGSVVTAYTVNCSGYTASGTSSPITVSGLTNGSVYTCTVTATNGAGTSAPSAASNAATPIGPPNSFALTGPNGGAIGAVSGAFTVTPFSLYTGTIIVTPIGGGLTAPVTLTFSNSAAPQTFTITPTAVGPVILTASNSGALSNPPAFTYATPSDAPVIGLAAPGNGSVTVSFTAPDNNGGLVVTGYTVDCSGYTASGTSSPITVSGLANGSAYSCTVIATNGAGASAPSAGSNAVTPVAPANSFALTGPGSGTIGSESSPFTVTPNSPYTGTITITPSGGGLSAPITLTFSNSAAAQTFTLTPTAVGPVTLTPSNSGTLSNPTALTFATPSAAPVIGTATAGNGSAIIAFAAPNNNGGSIITGYTVDCDGHTASGTSSPITVSGLANGTAYTCTVTATNGAGASTPSAASNAVTPIPPATNFALNTASSPTQTTTAGGTVTYMLALGPTDGITFPVPAIMSVTGLPPGATATLTPPVAPAGFPLTSVSLKVQLATSSASLDRKQLPNRRVPPVVWSILFVPFLGTLRRRNKSLRWTFCRLLLVGATLAAITGLNGCGSNSNGFFNQSPQTIYPLTVTATAGAVSHSVTVTLIVN